MKTCDVCGTEFKPVSRTQHLCGVSCRGRWLNMVRPPREVRDVACGKCGAPTPSRGPGRAYCLDCRTIERTCNNCGITFRQARHRPAARFCSRKCTGEGRETPVWAVGRDHPNWRGGDVHYRGPGWRTISKAIRDRDGWQCQDCGRPFRGRLLHVHHLWPAAEWDRPGNANDPENLVSLCGPCHSHRHAGYAPPDDVRATQERQRRRDHYLEHREERIAQATEWNRANADRRRANYARKRDERLGKT